MCLVALPSPLFLDDNLLLGLPGGHALCSLPAAGLGNSRPEDMGGRAEQVPGLFFYNNFLVHK